MRNHCGVAWVAAALVVLGGCAEGWGQSMEGKMGVDAASASIWRGITRTDGIVLQPAMEGRIGQFGVNVWGNFNVEDMSDVDDYGLFTETRLNFFFDVPFDPGAVGIGYFEYMYSRDREDSREIYGTGILQLTENLMARLRLFYDFGIRKDIYSDLCLLYGFTMTDNVRGEVGGSVGYAGKDMSEGGEGGMSDFEVYFSALYKVDDDVGLSGKLAYTDSLDTDVLPDQETHFYILFGVAQKF